MAWCSQIFCHSPRAGRISWQPDGPAQERASDEEANGLVSVKLLVLTAGHIAICRPCVQLFTSRRTGCCCRKRVGLSIGCSGRSITSIWPFAEKKFSTDIFFLRDEAPVFAGSWKKVTFMNFGEKRFLIVSYRWS